MEDLTVTLDNHLTLDFANDLDDNGYLDVSAEFPSSLNSIDMPISEQQAGEIIAHLQKVFNKPRALEFTEVGRLEPKQQIIKRVDAGGATVTVMVAVFDD